MENKHAYMIMAHNDFAILIEILSQLDHERNDIFLHIDKKTVSFPESQIRAAVQKGNLFLIPRMSISWGGYSQIECELQLMKCAVEAGHHEYYHMSTGATYPLIPSDEILEFFDQHKGYEFIGYDNSRDYSGRVKRYNFFNETGKAKTKLDEWKAFCRNKLRGLQGKIGFVYPPAQGIEFKKGFVYWSLTEEAVKYALNQYKWINKVFRHSFCGDELFMQTIIYHSPYRERIYNYDDEYKSCLRYVKPVQSWNPRFSGSSIEQSNLKETGISVKDLEKCVESDMLFGLKFVGSTGVEAIKQLQNDRKEEINR